MINYGLSVSLDTIDRDDIEMLRMYRNEYSIWKWCRQNNLISIKDQNEWYDEIAHDKTIRMYSIVNQENQVVGACGLTSIDLLNRHAEFSCYIAPNWQRCGYASAALKTLFSYGFQELNLNQIWGETFHGNPALQLFLNLDMVPTGYRRDFYFKGGKYLDAKLVSISRKEWETSKWIKQLQL